MAPESQASFPVTDTRSLVDLPPYYHSLSKSGKRRARSAKQKRLANCDGASESAGTRHEIHVKQGSIPVVLCWKPFRFHTCGHFRRIICLTCRTPNDQFPEQDCPVRNSWEAGMWYVGKFCQFSFISCSEQCQDIIQSWDAQMRYFCLVAAMRHLFWPKPSPIRSYEQIWEHLRSNSIEPKPEDRGALTLSDLWYHEVEQCRIRAHGEGPLSTRMERRKKWHGQKILIDLMKRGLPCGWPGDIPPETLIGKNINGSTRRFNTAQELVDERSRSSANLKTFEDFYERQLWI